MKPHYAAFTLTLFVLSGCGGGGGNGGGVTPQGPQVVTTGLSEYLPLASGNSWTFASGGRIVDQGASTLSCSCAYNGGRMEAHAIIGTNGSYSGTLYFAKASGIEGSGAPVTYLVGASTDNGQTITLAGPQSTTRGTTPGLGVMDDSPSASETFHDGGGDTSTITTVGQTVTYGNSTYANNATDSASGSNAPSLVLQLARGVGYTSISYNGQTTTLSSFNVSSSSQSVSRAPARFVRAVSGSRTTLNAVLRSLIARTAEVR